jgi:Transglycosylase-like domain
VSPRGHNSVLVVIGLLIVLVVALLLVKTARGNYWDRLAWCETRGRWHQRGTYYVGGLGIYHGNWWKWAPAVGVHKPAWAASREEQIKVAKYGRKVDRAYWGCMRIVGMPW